jgi:hypothetical protein
VKESPPPQVVEQAGDDQPTRHPPSLTTITQFLLLLLHSSSSRSLPLPLLLLFLHLYLKKGGEKSIEDGGDLLCAMVTKTKATAFPYI